MSTFVKKALGCKLIGCKIGMEVTLVASIGKHQKMFQFKLRNKRQLKQLLAHKWERIVDVTTLRTVYFIEGGTDCDGVSSSSSIKYKNIFAAEKAQDHAYEWADGPLYFTRCSKEEHMEYQNTWRDYGMEAHEDGHPHCRHG